MHHHIVIVGTGFGGLGAAIQLARAGIDDVVLLERDDDVGGTWRDNRYPGCACDIPSDLYAFSFAPNAEWTRRFAPQPEIQDYLRRCARDADVLQRVRFGYDVHDATWDDAARRWAIETSRGRVTADVLVLATGPLSEPVTPRLPGLDRFTGPAFHTARWDAGFDAAGKRIAVIGTGASSAQVVPALQRTAAALDVYQRTPAWVLPRGDRALRPWVRATLARVPTAQRLTRGATYVLRELLVFALRRPWLARLAEWRARRHLAGAVRDPAVRAAVTPRYAIGCKRIIVSDDYLPALAMPNVTVVTAPVGEVRARSIVDRDGVERATDAIVFATGFRATDPPLAPHVRGRDGRTLADAWAGSPRAYAGTTVAGFPNLFLLLGPNTAVGHTSILLMLEAQIAHLIGALRHLRAQGASTVEPRDEALAAWVAAVDRRVAGTVWDAARCRSWYLDATGRNAAIWPDFTWRFERRVSRFDPADYVVA